MQRFDYFYSNISLQNEYASSLEGTANVIAAPAEAPAKNENPMLRWYIVHVYTGFEAKAKVSLEETIRNYNLQKYFGAILIPAENVVEMVKGKKKTSSRKFYPGYILVQMELNDETWNRVKNTARITGFVGNSRQPPVVPEHEIAKITNQIFEGQTSAKPKVNFDKGKNVRIVEGPFANFMGVVEEVNKEKGKLKVMISIFGRSTPVEVEFIQVEKV